MSGADGRRGREVVGVFSDGYALESAVEELLNAGFDLGDISLLAGEKAVVDKLGHKYVKVEAAEDDAAAPARGLCAQRVFEQERGRDHWRSCLCRRPPWRPALRSRQAEPSRCFS